MRILLDECTPRIIQKRLPALDIRTVQEMGWDGIKNGELLRLAEADFDIFVTSDKNLRYQQNLSKTKLGVLVLPSNQVPVIARMMPLIESALHAIKTGEIVELPQPTPP